MTKKCPECQFEKSKHGTYEYEPHAPGCSKAAPPTESWVKDLMQYGKNTSNREL